MSVLSLLRASALLLAALTLPLVSAPVDAQGAPDQAFGSHGSILVGQYGPALGMAIAADDRITVAQIQNTFPPISLALTRFLADGTPDVQFGNQGDAYPGLRVLEISALTTSDHYTLQGDFVSAPDGGYYVAWSRTFAAQGFVSIILKLLPDGTLDPAFGDGGVAIERNGVSSLALAADGRLVVAGRQSGAGQPFVLRLLPDGARDPAFADGGVVLIDAANIVGLILDRPRVQVAPDNSILMTADAFNLLDYRPTLLRIAPDGTRDTAYANGRGVVTLGTLRPEHGYGNDAVVLADGSVVTAGAAAEGCTVARWTPQGELDESFGNAGNLVLSVEVPQFGNVQTNSRCSDLAVGNDDRIYVMGIARAVVSNVVLESNFVASLDVATGILDPGYGRSGIGLPRYSPGTLADISAIDSKGRVVVAGARTDVPLYIARLTTQVIFRDGFDQ